MYHRRKTTGMARKPAHPANKCIGRAPEVLLNKAEELDEQSIMVVWKTETLVPNVNVESMHWFSHQVLMQQNVADRWVRRSERFREDDYYIPHTLKSQLAMGLPSRWIYVSGRRKRALFWK